MSKAVYILEDEYELRSTLKSFLTQKGYEVHSFSDPTFCPLSEIQNCSCQRHTPCAEFIITDINMPGMSGLKFIELQKNKGCKVPHIAVMSASWSKEEYQKARELGCKVFDKPFSFADLLQWMQNCQEQPIIPLGKISTCNTVNPID